MDEQRDGEVQELEGEIYQNVDSSALEVRNCLWSGTYWKLFLSSFLSAWGDRMWSFAVPLLLAKMFSTLLPSSLFATISQLACVIFGSYVGTWIDRYNRIKLVQTALIAQNMSVVLSFVLLITLQYNFMGSSKISSPPWNNVYFVFLFFGSMLMGAVAAVASMITSIAMSKDWLVVIQKAHPYMPLNKVNATVRRIDLACKLLSPLLFATILQFLGLTKSLILVTSWNAISLIPESFLIQRLYRSISELHVPKNCDDVTQQKPNPISQILSGWRSYFAQPIFRSSLSYVLLYMTVLSPGGVMTAYLESVNMPAILIAVFTGLGALVGLLATFVTPHLIDKLTLRTTGLYSLWSQMIMLIFTIVPFVTSTNRDALILPLAIALSRFGLWAFDLVEVQLMQTYVTDNIRGTVSGVEYSMCNLISVFAFAMGIFVPDPKNFIYLVIASLVFVAISNLNYMFWHFQPPAAVKHIENCLCRGESIEVPQLQLDTAEEKTLPPSERVHSIVVVLEESKSDTTRA